MAQSTRIRPSVPHALDTQTVLPSPDRAPHVPPPADPHESAHQVLNRRYAELLQEVRIGQTCVQYLASFLMALAFMPRFADITAQQRGMYVTALITTLLAAALLTSPAPFHRVVFGRRLKARLVVMSNRLTLAGLLLLVVALGCALMLVLDVVGITAGPYIGIATLTGFVVIWFGLPLWCRLRHSARDEN
ncbi:DUF6328 family protein [Sphaerisporangium sp. NPDC051011]|uniref:DUF6328 family protein n=1 Tax=Sphaerisporangium sp. NPDC051011 TaxID=3155792 RepID=UPI0033F39DB2